MKKLFTIVFISFVLLSCSEENSLFELEILPIKEAITPEKFLYRNVDTITLKYNLPNGCHSFYSVYYESERNSRIVAINSILDNETNCTQAIIEQEIKIPIHALQEEDYIFKFFKGRDADGNSLFDEITVPVVD